MVSHTLDMCGSLMDGMERDGGRMRERREVGQSHAQPNS